MNCHTFQSELENCIEQRSTPSLELQAHSSECIDPECRDAWDDFLLLGEAIPRWKAMAAIEQEFAAHTRIAPNKPSWRQQFPVYGAVGGLLLAAVIVALPVLSPNRGGSDPAAANLAAAPAGVSGDPAGQPSVDAAAETLVAAYSTGMVLDPVAKPAMSDLQARRELTRAALMLARQNEFATDFLTSASVQLPSTLDSVIPGSAQFIGEPKLAPAIEWLQNPLKPFEDEFRTLRRFFGTDDGDQTGARYYVHSGLLT
ncbi:hypothetical protein SH668x_003455 [Planctomicrobium sp. SH668]|uniref:hypothetical protein n=1 Tax=Planctomicrobium sp. SH668 TaxID=3448126 RepID=UPI003F5C3C33